MPRTSFEVEKTSKEWEEMVRAGSSLHEQGAHVPSPPLLWKRPEARGVACLL